MTDSLEGSTEPRPRRCSPAILHPFGFDVREDYERAAGRIPGSLHIPLAELPQRAGGYRQAPR